MNIKRYKLARQDILSTKVTTDQCDQLSKLRGLDLEQLLHQIETLSLNLRESLNLDSYITFGTEIEFEGGSFQTIEDQLQCLFINKNNGWNIVEEATIKYGGEITSPILRDTKTTWEQLSKICYMLQSNNVIAGQHSGGHVHFGAQIIGNDTRHWINFFKLWVIYEKIIYRFSYGDKLTYRDSISYARPISEKLYNDFYTLNYNRNESFDDILSIVDYGRNYAFNTRRIFEGAFRPNNTIEIRCPNGSVEPIIWQNNINFFAKLFLYAKGKNYDNDIVSRRLKKYNQNDEGLELYDKIYRAEALELSDMIFDNNLDKLYFLKQYFKSFEVVKRDRYGRIKEKTLS